GFVTEVTEPIEHSHAKHGRTLVFAEESKL
ncbi:MAG: hypothetical protein QOF98_1494, partial [Streptomyces sp.]|nr:hypothetical protein [Streptomyces sp.]